MQYCVNKNTYKSSAENLGNDTILLVIWRCKCCFFVRYVEYTTEFFAKIISVNIGHRQRVCVRFVVFWVLWERNMLFFYFFVEKT